MIELYSYNTPQSTQIQKVWNSDSYLITKTAKIAYGLFIENVIIFVQNQSNRVRNLFAKKTVIPIPPKPVALEPRLPVAASSHASGVPPPYFPTDTSKVRAVLTSCLFIRAIWNYFELEFRGKAVPFGEKIANCGQLPGIKDSWINQFKQFELKNFALLSAAIPFTYNMIQAVRAEPSNLPLTKRVTRAVKKQFSAPSFIFYSTMIGLSLANSLYSRPLGITSRDGFDSSGHIMLKTVMVPIMQAVLSQTAQTSPILAPLYGSVYLMTEGVFLRNTINNCHTGMESIAGYAWGAGIINASWYAAHTFISLKSPKVV